MGKLKPIEETGLWKVVVHCMEIMLFLMSAALASMVFITVPVRYIMKSSIFGIEEVIMMMAIWIYYLGAAYGSYGHHDLSEIPSQAPTCLAPGHVAYWHCSVCDKNFTDNTGATEITAYVVKEGSLKEFTLRLGEMTDDERQIILDGCLINYNRVK